MTHTVRPASTLGRTGWKLTLCRVGPIVRINPHELHVKDSEWADVLYTGPASVSYLDRQALALTDHH